MRTETVMTDNGSAYGFKRFAKRLRRLNIKHQRTRSYSPRTNGKAERFIQTLLREWTCAYAYPDSDVRASQLAPWMLHYNFSRPHAATEHRPPASRLGFAGNTVVRNYIQAIHRFLPVSCACLARTMVRARFAASGLAVNIGPVPRLVRNSQPTSSGFSPRPSSLTDALTPGYARWWACGRQVVRWTWLMRKIWTDSFMTLAWACSELAAAASSSTIAEFCWVTASS